MTLQGKVPSKKNNYRYSAKGGYIPRETSSLLNALELQVRSQWKRDTLESAVIGATFYVKDGVSDLDNKLTSMIDILVKAKVVRNDNIKRVRRISAEAVIIKGGDEYSEVTVEPVGVAA